MTVPAALDLVEQAAQLADASIEAAVGTDPASRTPCTEWDLATLVRHVADSAATIRQLIDGHPPAPPPPAGCAAARRELHRLIDHIVHAPRERPAVDLAALLGAYELTVHAWDIDHTTGRGDDLPSALVDRLLTFAPLVLREVERTGLFASEVSGSAVGTDTDRLLALFGRRRDKSSPPV